MRFSSPLKSDIYLSAMKEQMSSFTDFGTERFTGIIVGCFFSITYHSGYEFNRRITNEKHRAIGFVSQANSGVEVGCIRLAGMTNPMSLFAIYCFCFIASVFYSDLQTALLPQSLMFYGFMTIFMSIITAIADSVTERGREGSAVLSAFLLDPLDFYSKVS